MPLGKIIGIYIAPTRGDATISIDQAHIIPGKGIVGDRYYDSKNNADIKSKPGQEITLIEMETLESMANDEGLNISPQKARRNIITSGIALNDLVGRTFFIGDLPLHGVRLCEPCQYLANRTDPGILPSMVHRGGLRAEILTEGTIHIDDMISCPD